MTSKIHYRFKNDQDYKTLRFDGNELSLESFRRLIGKEDRDYELQVFDAQTTEEMKDPEHLIAKNTMLLVKRMPLITGKVIRIESSEKRKSYNNDPVPWVPCAPNVRRCYNCGDNDHVAKECRKMPRLDDGRSVIKGCRSCGLMGHIARDCNRKLPDGYICNICGNSGHLIYQCPMKGIDLTNAPITRDTEEKSIKSRLQCPICIKPFKNAITVPCCYLSLCDSCAKAKISPETRYQCPLCYCTGMVPELYCRNTKLQHAVDEEFAK